MSLTPEQAKEAQAAESSEVFLVLVEVHHANFPTPFYMVDNTEDILSNGKTYVAWPFSVILGDDDGTRLPEVKITMDNVDRALVEIIRTTVTPPNITFLLVTQSAPDDISLRLEGMTLRNVEYDAYAITWTLHADSLNDSRFPADSISLASGYLGLFRS